MPKILFAPTMIAVFLLISTISYSQEGSKMPDDNKLVLAAVERMTAAFHAGDIRGVMASYEDEATVAFEPGKPVSDPVSIKEMFQGAFTLNPSFNYGGHEVFVAGDIAVHIAPWEMKGKTPDGQEIKQNGLSIAVLRKQADGRWLIVIDNPHGQNLMQKMLK